MTLTKYELPSDFGTTEDGDEEGVGNWMIGWDRQMKVEQRVACPEIGYSRGEWFGHKAPVYANIQEWEKVTGKKWYEEFCP